MEVTISSKTTYSINICLFLWLKDLKNCKMSECVFNMFYFSLLSLRDYFNKGMSGRIRFNDAILALSSLVVIINGFMI